MVASRDRFAAPDADALVGATPRRSRSSLPGRRVLTDGGYDIGELADVEFDESNGVLGLIRTTRTTVSAGGLLSIGPYAVVVRHDAVHPHEESAGE